MHKYLQNEGVKCLNVLPAETMPTCDGRDDDDGEDRDARLSARAGPALTGLPVSGKALPAG